MATYFLSPIALVEQWFTDAGITLQGGQLFTYLAGSSTPTATWTDNTGVTQNANPILLNGAGRLPNVQIWQAQNVPIKVIVTDQANGIGNLGNQIGPQFDQIYGINDPTSVFAQLASVAAGQGASLVANAVISYQLFSNLRAAGVPTLVSGQSLMVQVQGGDTIGDSKAGTLYWSASATGADDDNNTIVPTGAGATGRYLRLPTAGLPTLVNSLAGLTMVAGGLIIGASATALSVLGPGSEGSTLTLSGGVPVWTGGSGGAGVGTSQVQTLASSTVCGNTPTAIFSAMPVTPSASYALYAEIDGTPAGGPTVSTEITSDQSGTITGIGAALGWNQQESSGAYQQYRQNAAAPGISGGSVYNSVANYFALRGRFTVDSSTTSVSFSMWCGSGSAPTITVAAGSYIQLLRIK